jgi:protein-tyrosine-phosphatase
MARVLFVCTGNTCRSPMAERLARHHYPQHHWESAGVCIRRTGLSPWAVPVLEQMGASTADFLSRQVETVSPESFDHVVLIGAPAQEWWGSHSCLPSDADKSVCATIHKWDVDDPLTDDDRTGEQRLPVYRATADELLRRIHELAREL